MTWGLAIRAVAYVDMVLFVVDLLVILSIAWALITDRKAWWDR